MGFRMARVSLERPSTAEGRCVTSSYFQWVAGFMGSPRSRGNPVAETETKAQDGRKDGSVAANHQALALVYGAADSSENPAGSL
jgi:hypothetical protein